MHLYWGGEGTGLIQPLELFLGINFQPLHPCKFQFSPCIVPLQPTCKACDIKCVDLLNVDYYLILWIFITWRCDKFRGNVVLFWADQGFACGPRGNILGSGHGPTWHNAWTRNWLNNHNVWARQALNRHLKAWNASNINVWLNLWPPFLKGVSNYLAWHAS